MTATTVNAPVADIELVALPPLLLQSCILAPTPPVPPPIGDNEIYTPVAPGVTFAALPTVTIVDTSPTQVIGCSNDVGPSPQAALNALFPAAINGDGVVDRATNDFWVYDGSEWNNVGPTPGPTIVTTTVIPPWNEILVYDATVRTRLLVQPFDYALNVLTEVDPISTIVGLDARKVMLVPVSAAAEIEIEPLAPTVQILDPAISTVVTPFNYAGNGTEQTIDIGYSPSLILLASSGTNRNYVYDSLRGATKYWVIDTTAAEATNAQTVKTFDATGFTVGSDNLVNSATNTYTGYAFRPTAAGAANTAGTLTATSSVGTAHSIVQYTGNGSAGATFGHGLATAPQLVWIKSLTATGEAVAGGPVIGDNNYIELYFTGNRQSSTAYIRSVNTSTVELGTNFTVNTNNAGYVAYCFAEVPGISKIGTYVGDGDPGGQFIDCGFKVDFLLVKGRNGGTISDQSPWLLFHRGDDANTRWIELRLGVPQTEPEPYYAFEGRGFRAAGDNDRMFSQLNNNGATYLFMAFSYIIPTVEPPTAHLSMTALAPTV